MKTAMISSMVALMATAGAAVADEPIVLTEAQLDQVTAGGIVIIVIPSDVREIIIPSDLQGPIDSISIGLTLPNGMQVNKLLLPAVQK